MEDFLMTLSQSSKTILVAIGLCFAYLPSQAMIVNTSCLKDSSTKNKTVLFFDRHALNPNHSIKKSHVDDMHKLIAILANRDKPVPFLIEFGEAHKTPERLRNMMPSPAHMVTNLALKNNMQYGSITFIPFDDRKECDLFVRDMLKETALFAQAIEQKYPFPPQFRTITGDSFLEHLGDRYHSTKQAIDKLPVSPAIKKEYKTTHEQKYTKAYVTLDRLLKKYAITSDRHLFNLIVQLNPSEKIELFLATSEEQNNALDTNLLNIVLQQSKNHPLSIVLAGANHCHAVENFLTQFTEFKKDIASSTPFANPTLDDLATGKWLENVPHHFMNKKIEQFIADDTNK